MLEWMLLPLKRYADFSGRSRRKEYWMFVLGVFIAAILLSIVEGILGMSGMVGGVYGPLTTIFLLAVIIPSIAVQVRPHQGAEAGHAAERLDDGPGSVRIVAQHSRRAARGGPT